MSLTLFFSVSNFDHYKSEKVKNGKMLHQQHRVTNTNVYSDVFAGIRINYTSYIHIQISLITKSKQQNCTKNFEQNIFLAAEFRKNINFKISWRYFHNLSGFPERGEGVTNKRVDTLSQYSPILNTATIQTAKITFIQLFWARPRSELSKIPKLINLNKYIFL